jgi:hypothetical protein
MLEQKLMFDSQSSSAETKSRLIEAVVVFTLTVGLFLVFGHNEELGYRIKRVPLSRLIMAPLYKALIPSLLLLGTLYVSSYFQSRLVAWGVYAVGFFLLVGHYYPNFHYLIFWISN